MNPALYQHWKRQQTERLRRERLIADRVGELAASIAAQQHRLAVAPPAELQKGIRNLLPRFAAVDMSLQRYFAGEVPWTHWARPLARWGLLIALTYVAMMALNVLMFRQWARNEMITYPLAELRAHWRNMKIGRAHV